jgi:hypothetical protein
MIEENLQELREVRPRSGEFFNYGCRGNDMAPITELYILGHDQLTGKFRE